MSLIEQSVLGHRKNVVVEALPRMRKHIFPGEIWRILIRGLQHERIGEITRLSVSPLVFMPIELS